MLYHEAWKKLCECEGVLVPGGFGKRGVEGKIAASQWARAVQLPLSHNGNGPYRLEAKFWPHIMYRASVSVK